MSLTLDGSVTDATPEYIELDLLVVTSLPIDATPDSFQKATTMIEQHRLMDIHRDLIARADDNVQRAYLSMAVELARLEPDGKRPLSTFHRRFLALALDRGLDWMIRFADVLQQECWTDWSTIARARSRIPVSSTLRILSWHTLTSRPTVSPFHQTI